MLPFNMGMGGGAVDTGDIGHSLRFRSAASSYLNRLFGSPTNAYKWSFSTWVKLGNLGVRHFLLNGWNDSNNRGYLEINDSGVLRYDDFYGGSQKCLKVSTPVYRDPTGWLHIVCEADTDNATAEDRLRIYVNGVRVTSWSTNTNYGLSIATQINWASHQHYIGWVNNNYGDDYRARTVFVDNGSGGPSAYGYQNTEINEWVSKSQAQVKAVVDAGGANSFMLDFDDGTSLTTLGYDKSSKGNNWTLNNFSLTAGTSYDWMLDVPGNSFCVLNPIDRLGTTSNFDVISDGNLKVATNTAATLGSIGTMYMPSGSWYWEVTPNTWTSSLARVGVATPAAAQYCAYYSRTGEKNINGSLTAYGATYTLGDVIGVGYDATAGTVTFYKNGVSQGTISGIPSGAAPWVSDESGGGSVTLDLNFGQAPLHASATYHSAAGGYFRYAPPAGFKALCQRNMPDGESITTSGSFTGTLNADGPYIDIKGVPTAMTINGNAVTFGTHADKTSSGFKLRTASSSYNNTGSNTFSVTSTGAKRKYSLAQGNP